MHANANELTVTPMPTSDLPCVNARKKAGAGVQLASPFGELGSGENLSSQSIFFEKEPDNEEWSKKAFPRKKPIDRSYGKHTPSRWETEVTSMLLHMFLHRLPVSVRESMRHQATDTARISQCSQEVGKHHMRLPG